LFDHFRQAGLTSQISIIYLLLFYVAPLGGESDRATGSRWQFSLVWAFILL
jgi:hypothetical protein